MDSNEKPECYGSCEREHDECSNCDIVEECVRYTGRLNSRTKGLSRSRAMKALCWECNGGTSHGGDCRGPICPIYVFRKNNEGEPNLWWMKPAKDWTRAHNEARLERKKGNE